MPQRGRGAGPPTGPARTVILCDSRERRTKDSPACPFSTSCPSTSPLPALPADRCEWRTSRPAGPLTPWFPSSTASPPGRSSTGRCSGAGRRRAPRDRTGLVGSVAPTSPRSSSTTCSTGTSRSWCTAIHDPDLRDVTSSRSRAGSPTSSCPAPAFPTAAEILQQGSEYRCTIETSADPRISELMFALRHKPLLPTPTAV